ncbi:MAG: hypothetical protein ACOYXB_02340 [Bacteroidota bacterium]
MKKLFLVLTAILAVSVLSAQVKVDISRSNPVVSDEVNAVTLGIFHGGGALIGVDYERLISGGFGVQGGVGYKAFGFGLNYHFKPTTRSSYINLGYWHQGLGATYTQSLVGVTFVYRAKKILQASIGGGYQVDYNYLTFYEYGFELMYSLGVYLPF